MQIRPWKLSDADFVLDASLPLDPRKTVFVGGVPRPLKAGKVTFFFFFSVFVPSLSLFSCIEPSVWIDKSIRAWEVDDPLDVDLFLHPTRTPLFFSTNHPLLAVIVFHLSPLHFLIFFSFSPGSPLSLSSFPIQSSWL